MSHLTTVLWGQASAGVQSVIWTRKKNLKQITINYNGEELIKIKRELRRILWSWWKVFKKGTTWRRPGETSPRLGFRLCWRKRGCSPQDSREFHWDAHPRAVSLRGKEGTLSWDEGLRLVGGWAGWVTVLRATPQEGSTWPEVWDVCLQVKGANSPQCRLVG